MRLVDMDVVEALFDKYHYTLATNVAKFEQELKKLPTIDIDKDLVVPNKSEREYSTYNFDDTYKDRWYAMLKVLSNTSVIDTGR